MHHTHTHTHNKDIFSWYYTPMFRKYISAAYTLKNNFSKDLPILSKTKKEKKIEYLDKKRF